MSDTAARVLLAIFGGAFVLFVLVGAPAIQFVFGEGIWGGWSGAGLMIACLWGPILFGGFLGVLLARVFP